jgi:hypothetical protein
MKHMDQSEIMMDALRTDRATVANETAGTFHVLFQDGSSFVAPGLTKREYFAAMALQSIASKFVDLKEDYAESTQWTAANISVLMADALIEALNK